MEIVVKLFRKTTEHQNIHVISPHILDSKTLIITTKALRKNGSQ